MKTYNSTRFWLMLMAPILYLLGTTAYAASFNCGKASTLVEKMICLDYRLSDMDLQLVDLYQAKQLETGINKAELVASQRQWLAARNRCKSFDCLREVHIDRISALNFEAGQKYKNKTRSNILLPWDLRPPKGYNLRDRFFQVSDSAIYAELWPIRKIENQKFVDDGRLPGQLDVTGKISFEPFQLRPEQPQLWKQEMASALNDFYVKDGSDYHSCASSIDTTGLLIADIPFSRNEDFGARHLVVVKKQPWTFFDPPRCDEEIELFYKPLQFGRAVIYADSLYLPDDDFAIRFDRDLWTESSFVGRKVFAMWWSDLAPMLGSACQYSDKSCIDKRLKKLFDGVTR